MQWSKEEEEAARKIVEENSAVRVLLEEQGKQLYVSWSLAFLFDLPLTPFTPQSLFLLIVTPFQRVLSFCLC